MTFSAWKSRWSRSRTAASWSGGTATSSKTETGRAGPRNRINSGSTRRRQPRSRSHSARFENVAGAPASNPVRSAFSIAWRTRSEAASGVGRLELRPPGPTRPHRRSRRGRARSASRARRSERRSSRSHEHGAGLGAEQLRHERRRVRRAGGTAAGGPPGPRAAGPCGAPPGSRSASVPSEPATSRPRWIPDSSAARSSA